MERDMSVGEASAIRAADAPDTVIRKTEGGDFRATFSLGAIARAYPELNRAAVENGTPKGRAAAWDELSRMADAADKWNAYCKEESGK